MKSLELQGRLFSSFANQLITKTRSQINFKRSISNISYASISEPLKSHPHLKDKDPKSVHVAVGISGGVDSSVSALLLKKAGYNVTGVYMHNWEDERGTCTSKEDFQSAENICSQIGIPLQRVSFVKEYWNNVFSNFITSIENGLTPNPDVDCNRHIKFHSFYNHLIEKVGADYMATGHYAQVGWKHDEKLDRWIPQLMQSPDDNKDQTYFLCSVNDQVLNKTLFPIGHLHKKQVREIAQEYNLSTATRRDSYGICFVGQGNWTKFLSDYIELKQGKFHHLESGRNFVQKHEGAHLYTIGQNAKIGGYTSKLFVYKKDIGTNTVYVCEGSENPALFVDDALLSNVSWINGIPSEVFTDSGFQCTFRARHRQPLGKCSVKVNSKGDIHVLFTDPQRAATPGQVVAFYKDGICYGGGTIQEVGPNYHEQKKKVPEIFNP